MTWLCKGALIGGLALGACGGRAQVQDAPYEDASAAPGDDSGTDRAIGITPDASLDGIDTSSTDALVPDDGACGVALVTHVGPADATGLPNGHCTPQAIACASTPRITFACPIVRGPGDSGAIAPGDTIAFTVPMTNTVFLAYPCFGLTADHGVQATLPGITIYALKPTQAYPLVFTAQLPASLPRGTVVHFVAYVLVSSCPGDTGAVGFDVTVG
jgi:hypothetical protein